MPHDPYKALYLHLPFCVKPVSYTHLDVYKRQIDLNRATAAELDALPGVGPSTAEKIGADREANGPFRTVEDLKRVSGIGDKKFADLADLVCVG